MAKKNKKVPRNQLAVDAHFKTGAGTHTDKKKDANKKACRDKPKDDSQ